MMEMMEAVRKAAANSLAIRLSAEPTAEEAVQKAVAELQETLFQARQQADKLESLIVALTREVDDGR